MQQAPQILITYPLRLRHAALLVVFPLTYDRTLPCPSARPNQQIGRRPETQAKDSARSRIDAESPIRCIDRARQIKPHA